VHRTGVRRKSEGLLWFGEANVLFEPIHALLQWPKTLIDILSDVIHEAGNIVREPLKACVHLTPIRLALPKLRSVLESTRRL